MQKSDLWFPKIEPFETVVIGSNRNEEAYQRLIHGITKGCPPSIISQNNNSSSDSISVSSNNLQNRPITPQLRSNIRKKPNFYDEQRRKERETLLKPEILIPTPEIIKPDENTSMTRITKLTFDQSCQQILDTIFSGLDAKRDSDYITLGDRMAAFRKMEKELTDKVMAYEKTNPYFKKGEKRDFRGCFIRRAGSNNNCEDCDSTPRNFPEHCDKCMECDKCRILPERSPGCSICKYCKYCEDFFSNSLDTCEKCDTCKRITKFRTDAENCDLRSIARTEHKAKRREKTLLTRPTIQPSINYFNKIGHYHKIKFLFVTLTAKPEYLKEHSEDDLIDILKTNFDKFSDIKDLNHIASIHSIEYTEAGVPHLHGIIRYDATPFNIRVENGDLKQKSISATDCKFKKKNYITFKGKKELCELPKLPYDMLHKPKDVWNTIAYIAKYCPRGISDLIGDYDALVENIPEPDEMQSPPSP